MKSLKDLLRNKGVPVTGQETTVHIESVRSMRVRDNTLTGQDDLMASIEQEGLRHPIAVWTDGTIISGDRRLRTHFLLANIHGKGQYRQIRAVVVDTIEDAAKRLLNDNGDEAQSVPLKPSEICRLWEILRQLDAPAAARRLDEARRQGVELRRQTQAGKRKPGRSRSRGKGDEYLMSVLGEPFGMSEATASRLWAIYKLTNNQQLTDERRAMAAQSLSAIDAGESSVWANYARLISNRTTPVSRVRATAAVEPAPASRQRAAWERVLPQMEGFAAGLSELGPPNPDLTWEQVGPVHARLMKIRRDLEKIIKNMKETSQS